MGLLKELFEQHTGCAVLGKQIKLTEILVGDAIGLRLTSSFR